MYEEYPVKSQLGLLLIYINDQISSTGYLLGFSLLLQSMRFVSFIRYPFEADPELDDAAFTELLLEAPHNHNNVPAAPVTTHISTHSDTPATSINTSQHQHHQNQVNGPLLASYFRRNVIAICQI